MLRVALLVVVIWAPTKGSATSVDSVKARRVAILQTITGEPKLNFALNFYLKLVFFFSGLLTQAWVLTRVTGLSPNTGDYSCYMGHFTCPIAVGLNTGALLTGLGMTLEE